MIGDLETKVTEINSILKAQPEETLLENRFSQLMDKITQVENSAKVQLTSLSARITELEAENCNLKTENIKLRSEIQNVKGKVKLIMQSNDKLNHTITDLTSGRDDTHPPDKDSERQFSFPDDVPISNNFSVLQEDSDNPSTNNPLSQPPQLTSSNNELNTITPPIDQPLTTTRNENPAQQDDIILLIDSNGKYIDTSRFIPNKQTRKIFCATVSSATKALTETSLGRPSHIHVGTNDIERSSLDSCYAQLQTMVDVASQKYSSSKILISSLLKRRDVLDHRRLELNSKTGSLCAAYPNVHLVHNDNITEDFLHDDKHLKRRKIGALVVNMKDDLQKLLAKEPNKSPHSCRVL